MRTKFIRKATKNDLLPSDKFVVRKVVNLSQEDFYNFLSYPLRERDYIKDRIDLMFIDSNNVWNCIFITTEEADFGILIQSEGYGYARYSANVRKEVIDLKKERTLIQELNNLGTEILNTLYSNGYAGQENSQEPIGSIIEAGTLLEELEQGDL